MRRKLHAPTSLGLPRCGATGSVYYATDPARVSCERCLRSERGTAEGSVPRSDPVSPGASPRQGKAPAASLGAAGVATSWTGLAIAVVLGLMSWAGIIYVVRWAL